MIENVPHVDVAHLLVQCAREGQLTFASHPSRILAEIIFGPREIVGRVDFNEEVVIRVAVRQHGIIPSCHGHGGTPMATVQAETGNHDRDVIRNGRRVWPFFTKRVVEWEERRIKEWPDRS
jgi:hypothetical protein